MNSVKVVFESDEIVRCRVIDAEAVGLIVGSAMSSWKRRAGLNARFAGFGPRFLRTSLRVQGKPEDEHDWQMPLAVFLHRTRRA